MVVGKTSDPSFDVAVKLGKFLVAVRDTRIEHPDLSYEAAKNLVARQLGYTFMRDEQTVKNRKVFLEPEKVSDESGVILDPDPNG